MKELLNFLDSTAFTLGSFMASLLGALFAFFAVRSTDKKLRREEEYKYMVKVLTIDGLRVEHIRPVEAATSKPPGMARKVARFALPYKRHEAMLGDLEEMFPNVVKDQGLRSAKRWYAWQVTLTIATIYVKGMLRWSAIIALGEKIRRFIS
jgi:hypothetical protein